MNFSHHTRPVGRRGAMEVQEIFLFLALFFIAFLLFIFFYWTAKHLEKQTDTSEVSAVVSATTGDLFLQGYLWLPLDDAERALPLWHAIADALDDHVCVDWLTTDQAGAAPSPACAALAERTYSFFRPICAAEEFHLSISRGETTILFSGASFSKAEAKGLPLVTGRQHISSQQGTVTLSLTCRELYGVEAK